MQYANCGNLQNYLEKNLKDLHSKSIVIHDDNAKITDFGISRNMNTQNSSIHIGNFGRIRDREIAVENTPKLYEELYKKCWDTMPEKRPSIRKVLDDLEKIIEEKKPIAIEVSEESKKICFEDHHSYPKETDIDVSTRGVY
ncbi:10954_t:CDS:2 [Funneliformis mosseae]|uniref:10954_t:CDS:1 n=1 Tax=Funneliformis mosseae TaxID=27381 RepID=A0A9N8ZG68_FUNMO|nr:10954_t:CDS:2 [Funneliformis mosseae]